MKFTKELQAIGNKLRKLSEQTDALAAILAGTEKKPGAKAGKAVSKNVPSGNGRSTDADKVVAIINRSKKGVAAATPAKKTGFDLKKVRNILARTYKQGKIARPEKSVYIGAEQG